MHPAMHNLSARHHAQVLEIETKPMSRLNKIHLQLHITTYGDGPAMSLCIPDPIMMTAERVQQGTICCARGHCDVNCLFYYSTKFHDALQLLEDLERYAIEIKEAVSQDAPEPYKQ